MSFQWIRDELVDRRVKISLYMAADAQNSQQSLIAVMHWNDTLLRTSSAHSSRRSNPKEFPLECIIDDTYEAPYERSYNLQWTQRRKARKTDWKTERKSYYLLYVPAW